MKQSYRAAGLAAVSALAIGLSLPARAQNITIAVGAQVTSLDPHYHALSPNFAVAEMLFGGLTTFDSSGRLQPGLAESWKPVAPDTWEFKLRPNVTFHNGKASPPRTWPSPSAACPLCRTALPATPSTPAR
jgi:peptide/nickel transport system substrate-binding protein